MELRILKIIENFGFLDIIAIRLRDVQINLQVR